MTAAIKQEMEKNANMTSSTPMIKNILESRRQNEVTYDFNNLVNIHVQVKSNGNYLISVK